MRRPLALAFAAALLAAPLAHAATITIVNADAAGEGFNDPTVVPAVGGNSGTTVGQQRLIVFQTAANLWGAILPDNIEVKVNAQFNPLSCSATSGVLGSAGASTYYRDFPNAIWTGTWYHVALANKLANSDLDGGASPDINAQFNSSVGSATCLTVGWYYGLDGNEGSQIELLPVVIHELGHGLGFSTITNGSSGAQSGGFPSLWDHYLLDRATGLHWDSESDAQRAASAISCNKLAWDGMSVRSKLPTVLGTKPVLRVTAPAGVAGDYEVGTATFGAALNSVGVTGQVVLANDNFGNPTNGCETFLNNLSGKIAFIDRGTCGFTTKVKNAQLAGAIGAIVADTLAGCPPAGMGGSDATITIPSVRITQADGVLLKAALASGVTATLLVDPSLRAGADGNGRAMMYAPNPYQGGSSVSHFDTSAEPSLLMEPAITTGLHNSVDLTQQLFVDIGWFGGAASVGQTMTNNVLMPAAPNPTSSGTAIAFSLAQDSPGTLCVYDIVGREVTRLAEGTIAAGPHVVQWNATDAWGRRLAPGLYHVQLRTKDFRQSRSLVIVR